MLESRLKYWETKTVKAKHKSLKTRAMSIVQRIQEQLRKMRERHAQMGRTETRKKTWAMEKTGCASLNAMAKKPEGRPVDVLEMRKAKKGSDGEREVVVTQEAITAEYEEHFTEKFNKHN